ncbi:nuclease-related domain-containing protein [Kitasatospora sp. NPDC088779]|uniref:nuclease-related domain-containing protein n=1 Tax=Kitasatospora sp. NPDC088779 TaxID=3154964 RepID=UPI0034300761
MTTSAYRSTYANVAGASARHEAAKLREGKTKWVAPPRAKPSATELVPRRPTVAKSFVLALAIGSLGFFIHYVVALVLAAAVFIAVKTYVVEEVPRLKPKSKASSGSVGRAVRVPPTPQELAEADNWDHGAAGEEETERILSVLERRGWTILHDRRIPGSTANLDHIAIGPRGQVVVIDSKNRRPIPGAVLRLSPDGEGLRYGNYDWSKIVTAVRAEVRKSQGEMLVEPSAMVVIHGVKFGSMPVMRCNGVLVVRPDKLVERLELEPRVTDKPWIASHLDRTFPPYME